MIVKDLLKEVLCCDLGDKVYNPGNVPEAEFKIIVRGEGILCGAEYLGTIIEIVEQVFFLTPNICDPMIYSRVSVRQFMSDGDQIHPGDVIAELYGNAEVLLKAERTVCNILSRLSGIATFTRQQVRKLEGTNVKLFNTRKGPSLLGPMDKDALLIGGAKLHRSSLDHGVMIKDNDIKIYGGIKQALDTRLRSRELLQKVEVEVADFLGLTDVLSDGRADVIMLDNMNLDDMTMAVKLIKKSPKRYEIEASGIGHLDIAGVAKTGIDYISTSSLISKGAGNPVDISMKTS